MKELNIATTEEELDRLKEFRAKNLSFALSNPNENEIYKKLPVEFAGKPIKWERQYIFGYRILDFYCPEMKIAVEVDGEEHDREYDNYRDEYLFRVYGVPTLRVRNKNINDLNEILKIIPAIGKSTFGNRNILFKDCLGPNASKVDIENLAKQIPYDKHHCLLGRFLLSRGMKSEYQKFKKHGKKHWNFLVTKYRVSGKNRRSDARYLKESLSSLGLRYFKSNGSFIFNTTPEEEVNYKKFRVITDNMIVLRKDMSFVFKGLEGEGLDQFFDMFNKKEENIHLIRTNSPYIQCGEEEVKHRFKVKFKDYVDARCKNLSLALTNDEAKLFGVDLSKAWYKRHASVEIHLDELLFGLKNKVVKNKNISPVYMNNIKNFIKEKSSYK